MSGQCGDGFGFYGYDVVMQAQALVDARRADQVVIEEQRAQRMREMEQRRQLEIRVRLFHTTHVAITSLRTDEEIGLALAAMLRLCDVTCALWMAYEQARDDGSLATLGGYTHADIETAQVEMGHPAWALLARVLPARAQDVYRMPLLAVPTDMWEAAMAQMSASIGSVLMHGFDALLRETCTGETGE